MTSATRTQQLPDVPTVEQAGFPGFEAVAWFALAAPTGTPADIIDRINAAVNAFLRSDKGRQELNKLDRCRRAVPWSNQSLHRRRSPQMGTDHHGGEDQDVAPPRPPPRSAASGAC